MFQVTHKILAEKAVQISLAAIEAYNKPYAQYREESFAILMVNAWGWRKINISLEILYLPLQFLASYEEFNELSYEAMSIS